jgi:aminoglycoside phosphotransferase (APT) family kinase protein
MRPVVDWLQEHRPGGPPSLCHGDLFGNQVFEHRGGTAGVIDWSDAFIAPGELDVGIVKAGIETIPVSLPGPLASLGERIVRRLTRRFVAAYRARRPLDPERVRYGEALRCAVCLVGVAERRLARTGRILAEPRPHPYDNPIGVERLCAHLESITWVCLEPDCVEPGARRGERACVPR